MPLPSYTAVLLAGGDSASQKRLYPLTAGVTRALLPVGNRPLIYYSLKTFLDAGVRHAIVVAIGEKTAASINAWLAQEYTDSAHMKCEVVAAPEDSGTADALRSVSHKITADTFVVMSGDIVSDVPLQAVVTSHLVHNAMATALITQRKMSPSADSKPGKPPKGVDYIGLDAKRERLLFFASSVETIKNLKLPLAALGSVGNLTISTDLADSHLYVFNRAVLSLLRERNNLASLKLDFMPVLVREQLRLQLQQQQGAAAAAAAGAAAGTPPPLSRSPSLLGPGMQGSPSNDGSSADFGSAAHRAGQPPLGIRVYTLQPETYLGRITSVPAYGSVNHDVAAADVALHLTGVKASKVDNVVPASTTLGNKTTVAAACIVGERCSLGDKASVKRSVIGHNCKVGVNVKVINSVLMDNVTVGEGCHIQNTVVCAGASVGAGATLKDCTVGPGYQVAGGAEYKSEELVKGAAAK